MAMIVSFGSYAQKVSTTATNSPSFTSKDSALCNQWKLVSIEEFGVANSPNEGQKNDAITFTADGSVFLMREGKAQTGTWTLDKARTNIILIFEQPKEQLRFKLMKVDEKQLRYEYQNPDLIRTIFTYEPVKK